MLAPIGLTTYNRLEHLKCTIEALQRNTLASVSELYIFSDAPQVGDEEKVQAVRDFLKTIKGFKQVHIIEREENNFVLNHSKGIRMLLDQYGKMVFLEEDVVTAPGFLRFMNEALDFYEKDERIFAICGYTPPVKIPRGYRKDVYLSPRLSAWGVGFWKDRYDKIIMNITEKDYERVVYNKANLKAFCAGGADLPGKLKRLVTGKVDALDIRIFYTQYVLGMFTLHPTLSLTNNIGMDGSGLHCGETNLFDVKMDSSGKRLSLEAGLEPDPNITRVLYRFRSMTGGSLRARIHRRLWQWFHL